MTQPLGALMLDVAGQTLTANEAAQLTDPQVGGVILFGRNVSSPRQVADLTAAIRAVRPELLITVDQEGGRVQRLKQGFTLLPAMGRLGQLYAKQPEHAQQLAELSGWLMATEVLAVGIDLSFAPVLDLDRVSQVIGDRGFHADPAVVTLLAKAFIQGMRRAGMAATGKHFPGHGSTEVDSHIGAALDDRTLAEIEATDIVPFAALLPELSAVMPAHVIYTQVDPNPAGFSTYWIQTQLRKKLGFQGVIFSDDLSMQAACVAGDCGARALAALQAGCDMVLVCNDRTGATQALKAITQQPLPDQSRLLQLRGRYQTLAGDALDLGAEWEATRGQVTEFLATSK